MISGYGAAGTYPGRLVMWLVLLTDSNRDGEACRCRTKLLGAMRCRWFVERCGAVELCRQNEVFVEGSAQVGGGQVLCWLGG